MNNGKAEVNFCKRKNLGAQLQLDCKTVVFFANALERSSNARS